MHPAGAMFDKHQDMQSPQQHGVHVQEIDGDDPGSLGVQELPLARARAPRCWIDAGRTKDLPHGGGRDCHAELREYQQLSILRQVAAEHQDRQAEYPAREQVGDLEQHPAS
jgi:hypothetical protein